MPSTADVARPTVKRVTVILEVNVDKRLEVFCAVTGTTKNDAIGTAVSEYLESKRPELSSTLIAMAAGA